MGCTWSLITLLEDAATSIGAPAEDGDDDDDDGGDMVMVPQTFFPS